MALRLGPQKFFLLLFISLAVAIDVNRNTHPYVMQSSNSAKIIIPSVPEAPGNKSNVMKFKFQDYSTYLTIREYASLFMKGANISWYSPNMTVCVTRSLNLA